MEKGRSTLQQVLADLLLLGPRILKHLVDFTPE